MLLECVLLTVVMLSSQLSVVLNILSIFLWFVAALNFTSSINCIYLSVHPVQENSTVLQYIAGSTAHSKNQTLGKYAGYGYFIFILIFRGFYKSYQQWGIML